MSHAIEVRGVTKVYPLRGGGERVALDGIDLCIDHGEFVCLLGPSGCGKTTLLNILSGLDRADGGSVSVQAPEANRPAVSGYMFQESRLLPWLTIAENVAFVLDAQHHTASKRATVAYWLERVGLAGREDDYPRQLSIGQQQRAAVARALAIRPDVLFMDEPFSALDELTASLMRSELLDLQRETGATILFVTHNPLEAAVLADRIVVMAGEPGVIRSITDVAALLPRPRSADDARLWEVSRQAVRALRDDAPTPGTPTT